MIPIPTYIYVICLLGVDAIFFVIGFLAGHRVGANEEKEDLKMLFKMHERRWKREHEVFDDE